jgi:cytoskeleton protein RodZ
MSEPLGQCFKRAREGRGWTLEQAAAKTRILPEYLRAVEEDNYERLPEEVFAKGFVRSYARLLSLDETEVLHKFNETGGQFYAKRTEREQLRVQLREEERRKKTNQLIVAGMIGVAVVALLLITGRDRGTVKPAPDQGGEAVSAPRDTGLPDTPAKIEPIVPVRPEAPTRPEPLPRVDTPSRDTTPPTPQTESLPVKPRESLPSTASPAPVQNERNAAGQAPVDGTLMERAKLILDVEAIERSWVMVQADRNPAEDVLLAPGDHVRWSAAEKLTLTLGNAGGVKVLINGKPQGPYGASGKVVKDLVFTR